MKNHGLQNNDFYPHAIWDAWYTHTHRWHMERNFGFVATFLNFSGFFSTMLKSEENKEKWRKWRKRKKSEENEEKWRKLKKHKEKGRKAKKSEEN